jgi:Tol biopolymer transport system component
MAMFSANRTVHFGPTLLLSMLVGLSSRAQEAQQKEPDLGVLAKAGQRTLDRLEKQPATWTAITQLAGNTRVIVDVVTTPSERRTRMRIEAQGERSDVLGIIMRDGLWYASEGARAGKYRPYEAPFDLPTAYLFLTRSDPHCIVQTKGMNLGAYEGTRDGILIYRTPLPEPLKRMMQNMLKESEELTRRSPELSAKPEMIQAVARMRDLLLHGNPTKVEAASGMIIQFGAANQQTELHDFRWLDHVNPDEFRVEGKKWQDFADDPTENDASNLLMIAHNGTWRPGMQAGDADGRLVDLRTGRFRRIPFQGAITAPGCFLRDRSRVVVSGLDAMGGVLGLYEVNLKTGENRLLGGNLFTSGFTFMPALAPNGQTIAVLHMGAAGKILETQLCLVDLKTGSARPLSNPGDMAFPSWLPDGKGLVLLLRERSDPADVSSATTHTIARMDLEGRITKIRQGDSPVLLADGKTILFQDTKSRTWNTCDLDGGHVAPYAGGLPGYGFPSPAPDGKRIVMMHFARDRAPIPTILPIGDSKGEPAVKAPGLWASPAWR